MQSAVEKALSGVAEEAKQRAWASVDSSALAKMVAFANELAKWNRRFNLTSITNPEEVAELHFLDSLAIVPLIPEGSRLLDVGTGGGFPGVPVAIARPDVTVLMVDRTEKKIAFLKSAIARLRLGNAEAMHQRIEGDPEGEGLGFFDVVVSRAFAGPEAWLPLGAHYAKCGGRVLAMLGAERFDRESLLDALGAESASLEQLDYVLPSGHQRGIVIARRA
jgi:16S rRNA (guanine527-N7)-methyltransferase